MEQPFDVDLVGKIGSMALIRREDEDIDYNIFARLGGELRPALSGELGAPRSAGWIISTSQVRARGGSEGDQIRLRLPWAGHR
jgi:hypothetical protein